VMSQQKQRLNVRLALVCILAMAASALAQQTSLVTRPVITSLHPSAASAKSGSSSVIVFVAGQNFVAGVTSVEFQGSRRAATVLNSEVLAFELTSADLSKPQAAMVTAVNQSGLKLLKSNSLPFVVLP
jgi:IPT/TIG domain-containing protein